MKIYEGRRNNNKGLYINVDDINSGIDSAQIKIEQYQGEDNKVLAKVVVNDKDVYDYSSLSNKPQINDVGLDGNKSLADLGINLEDKADKASLSTVATSGDYNDLSNIPEIPEVPTKVSAFENDANYAFKSEVEAEVQRAEAVEDSKLNILPNIDDPSDPGYGWPYHIPYNFIYTPDADKLNITLQTLTLDNNLSKMDFESALPAATTELAGLMSAEDKTALDNKLNVLPNVDDPEDPGYGWPYHIPYDFDFTPAPDGLNIKLKTLTLDNKLSKKDFESVLPTATEDIAGLMSAEDKVKLDNAINTLQTVLSKASLDQIVVDALTNSTITLTEDQKMSIRSWLGL